MKTTFQTLILSSLLAAGSAVFADELTLGDGWIRAMPPGQSNTAAYLVVHNSGDQVRYIEGVTTPLAQRAEVHRSVTEGDRVRMEAVPRAEVPAGGELTMAPGGMHLMLMGLTGTLTEGDTSPVCLAFDGGDELCGNLPIVRGAPDVGHHHHHGSH